MTRSSVWRARHNKPAKRIHLRAWTDCQKVSSVYITYNPHSPSCHMSLYSHHVTMVKSCNMLKLRYVLEVYTANLMKCEILHDSSWPSQMGLKYAWIANVLYISDSMGHLTLQITTKQPWVAWTQDEISRFCDLLCTDPLLNNVKCYVTKKRITKSCLISDWTIVVH